MPDAGIACVPESSTYPASGNLQSRLDHRDEAGRPYRAGEYGLAPPDRPADHWLNHLGDGAERSIRVTP
jgi:hypothetical protein